MPIIFIIIIIIILFYYISIDYQLNRNKYFSKLPEIDDLLSSYDLKTGDIIVLCSDGLYDNYNIISYSLMEILQYYIMGNYTTHMGIIIIYDDKPYVYHMAAYPTFDDYKNTHIINGPVHQYIKKYIEPYPGYVLLCKAPLENDTSEIYDLVHNNKYKYSINPFNWLIDLNFKTNYFTKDDELYCYELIAYVLGFPNYRNISSKELLTELGNKGYSDPCLLHNLYKKYRFNF